MTDEREEETPQTDLALVPVQSLFTPEEAYRAWQNFLKMKQRLLDDDDYQMIAGKRVTKKSGYRKIGVWYNLSDRIIEQERMDREDGSFVWRIVVEMRAPNGRVCTGVGACDSSERGFAHIEHDVYATAHTRAKTRGISDMVAGGAVSAEMMTPEVTPATGQADGTTTDLDEAGIVDHLESAGLDTEELEITIDLEGVATVKPKKFLGEQWESYKNALWPIGLSWVKAEGGWRGRAQMEAPDE